jgi:hypothetical protein
MIRQEDELTSVAGMELMRTIDLPLWGPLDEKVDKCAYALSIIPTEKRWKLMFINSLCRKQPATQMNGDLTIILFAVTQRFAMQKVNGHEMMMEMA